MRERFGGFMVHSARLIRLGSELTENSTVISRTVMHSVTGNLLMCEVLKAALLESCFLLALAIIIT